MMFHETAENILVPVGLKSIRHDDPETRMKSALYGDGPAKG